MSETYIAYRFIHSAADTVSVYEEWWNPASQDIEWKSERPRIRSKKASMGASYINFGENLLVG